MNTTKIFEEYLHLENVAKSKMFGYECLQVNGNVFACNTGTGMTFKISGDALNEALKLPGVDYFDPMGNGVKMKAWVFSTEESAMHWNHLCEDAFNYVSALPTPKSK